MIANGHYKSSLSRTSAMNSTISWPLSILSIPTSNPGLLSIIMAFRNEGQVKVRYLPR